MSDELDLSGFDEEIENDEIDLSGFDESIPMGGELGFPEMAEQVMSEQPPSQPLPEISQSGAFGKGAQQGLTFGFSDEMGAGVQSGLDRTQRLLNEYTGLVGKSPTQVSEGMAQEGFSGDLGPTSSDELYEESVAEDRKQLAAAEEQHPWTYLAGDVVGGALLPVPGMGKLKQGKKAKELLEEGLKHGDEAAEVVGTLATKGDDLGKAVGETAEQATKFLTQEEKARKVAQVAATGAGYGGLEAAGRTEEDLMSKEGLTDVATGAGVGGLFGGAMGKLGTKWDDIKASKMADKVKDLYKQGNIAVASAAGATSSIMKEILGSKTNKFATSDSAKGVGKTLVDEGLFKIKQTAQELKDSIVSKMKEVGSKRLKPLAKEADDLMRDKPLDDFIPDLNQFAKGIGDDVAEIANKKRYAKSDDIVIFTDMEKVSKKVIRDTQEAFESPDRISKLLQIKRELQGNVNWSNPEATAYNEYLVKLQGNLSNMIGSIVKKSSPELAERMASANKVYHNLTIANRLAADKAVKEAIDNKGITFRDYFLGGAVSAVSGSKVVGAAVVGGKKLSEHVTGKKAGDILESVEAIHKFRKAKDIEKKLASGGQMIDAPGTKTLRGVTTGAAILDENKSKEAPYKRHQRAAKMAEKSTPESLVQQSQSIRKEYGEEGEKLATILENMSKKDKSGRQALMFHILQTPQHRKMLKLMD